MRALDEAVPFYTADLYKRYFSMDYTPILTGEEKAYEMVMRGEIKDGKTIAGILKLKALLAEGKL